MKGVKAKGCGGSERPKEETRREDKKEGTKQRKKNKGGCREHVKLSRRDKTAIL